MEEGAGVMGWMNLRRLTVTGALVAGGVVGVVALAWACTPLIHSVTFQIAPASTCEDPDGDGKDYDCKAVPASVVGHGTDCPGGNSVGCQSEVEVFQTMTPKVLPHQALLDVGCDWSSTNKIGSIMVTALHEVEPPPNPPGDPLGVTGWFRAGADWVTPKVVDDSSSAGAGHGPLEVRFYKVCEPLGGRTVIGLAKL